MLLRLGYISNNTFQHLHKRKLSTWRNLSKIPSISIYPQIIPSKTCQQIIQAVRPTFSKYFDTADEKSADEKYHSLPFFKCGNEAIDILTKSGILDLATNATNIPYHAGEDIMIARTIGTDTENVKNDGFNRTFISMHHDRNNTGDEGRVRTFMIYLTTIADESGGETYFPAMNTDIATDDIAQRLKSKYEAGIRVLPLDSDLSVACEERLELWRESRRKKRKNLDMDIDLDFDVDSGGDGDTGNEDTMDNGLVVGGGAVCKEGTALMFDAGGEGGAYGSWHSSCCVKSTEEKWIITFFKSPAPRWSSSMMGL